MADEASAEYADFEKLVAKLVAVRKSEVGDLRAIATENPPVEQDTPISQTWLLQCRHHNVDPTGIEPAGLAF